MLHLRFAAHPQPIERIGLRLILRLTHGASRLRDSRALELRPLIGAKFNQVAHGGFHLRPHLVLFKGVNIRPARIEARRALKKAMRSSGENARGRVNGARHCRAPSRLPGLAVSLAEGGAPGAGKPCCAPAWTATRAEAPTAKGKMIFLVVDDARRKSRHEPVSFPGLVGEG